MGSSYSEQFKIKVGAYDGSVLSQLLFAVVLEVITKMHERL